MSQSLSLPSSSVNAVLPASDSLDGAAQAIAEGYINTLDQTPWLTELSSWMEHHKNVSAIDTFQSTDYDKPEYEIYCFKTEIAANCCTTKVLFLDNADWTQPKATLQQVTIADVRADRTRKVSEEVWKRIAAILTTRFGAPAGVPKKGVLEFFSYDGNALFWQDSIKKVVLTYHFRWDEEKRTDFILLLARANMADPMEVWEDGHEFNFIDKSEILDSLRLRVNPLMNVFQPGSPQKVGLRDLVRCAKFVSTCEHSDDSVRLPLYRLALFVLGKSYVPPGDGDKQEHWADVDTLQKYGVHFEWSHLGSGWYYSLLPLEQLYRRYPGSHWGQIALLTLLNAGWCTSYDCGGCMGSAMASEGVAFLQKYPNSPFALPVLLSIGRGYEAEWNVSTCDPKSEYMYDENHRSDQQSRLKAIEAYERVVAIAPDSQEAQFAKYRLPRLKLGVNTGHTEYYFVYD